jgi:hypothetical protein
MSTIILKLSKLDFISGSRAYRGKGTDIEALSDRTLKDIGFRLARRDLNSVKPFWLA